MATSEGLVTAPDQRRAEPRDRPRDQSHDRASAPAQGLRIEVSTDIDAIAGLWRGFESKAHHTVFQTHAWCRTWMATVGAATGVTAAIGIVRDGDGSIALVAPLGLKRRRGVRELVCLGEREADYHAPLLASGFQDRYQPAEARALLERLLDTMPPHDIVSLERVPETVGEVRNPFLLLGAAPYYEDAYWAALDGACDDFLRERCGAKTLQTLRRKRRKLAAGGEVRFVLPTGRETAADLLDALFAQKSAQFRRTGAADVLALPGRADFYRALALGDAAAGMSHLSGLMVGDEIVAAHWGLVEGGRFHYLLASYAEGESARHSPGEHLLVDLLAWSFANDVRAFDFTNGAFGYKDRWSQHRLKLYRVLAPRTWRGRAMQSIETAIRAAKTVARKSPILWKVVTAARSRGWVR